MAPDTRPSKLLRDLNLKIMCAGDSITTGCEPLENSYRKLLFDALEAEGSGNEITPVGLEEYGSMQPPPRNKIDAIMGRKISETHTALKNSLSECDPDVILLHTGTNDVAPHEKTPDGLPDEVDWLLETISQHAQSCNDRLVTLVALIIPASFRGPQIARFNQQVREKVNARAERGQRLLCVDMFTEWPDDTMRDIAHPNAKGYEEMARRWLQGLKEANAKGWLS